MVDTGKLFRLINGPNTSPEERKIAERVYDQVYLFKDEAQILYACDEFFNLVHEYRSHSPLMGSINFFNKELYDMLEDIYSNRHSICIKNQKE